MTTIPDSFLGEWAANIAALMLRPDLETPLFVAVKLAKVAGKNLHDVAVRNEVMTEVIALDAISKDAYRPAIGVCMLHPEGSLRRPFFYLSIATPWTTA